MFSGIWLHSKNSIFLLVSHIFSTSKQIYKLKRNKNQNKTFVKLKNSVKLREGGRESDQQLRERERQIEKERDQAWVGHGCDLADVGVQSRQCFKQRDLDGAGVQSQQCFRQRDFAGTRVRRDWCNLGLGAVVRSRVTSSAISSYCFSLSLLFSQGGNHLKVKQKLKFISSLGGLFYSQRGN